MKYQCPKCGSTELYAAVITGAFLDGETGALEVDHDAGMDLEEPMGEYNTKCLDCGYTGETNHFVGAPQ